MFHGNKLATILLTQILAVFPAYKGLHMKCVNRAIESKPQALKKGVMSKLFKLTPILERLTFTLAPNSS